LSEQAQDGLSGAKPIDVSAAMLGLALLDPSLQHRHAWTYPGNHQKVKRSSENPAFCFSIDPFTAMIGFL